MQTIKKFLNWLVYSSADPRKYSLTVKAAILGIIPFLVPLSHFTSIHIGEQDVTNIANAVGATIDAFFTLVAAVLFLVGLFRKLLNTFYR